MTGADLLDAARRVVRAEQALASARLHGNDAAPFIDELVHAMDAYAATFDRAMDEARMVVGERERTCARQ